FRRRQSCPARASSQSGSARRSSSRTRPTTGLAGALSPPRPRRPCAVWLLAPARRCYDCARGKRECAMPIEGADLADCLPDDADDALLIGRVWVPDTGPCVAAVRGGQLVDLTRQFPTVSELVNTLDVKALRKAIAAAPVLGPVEAVATNGELAGRNAK